LHDLGASVFGTSFQIPIAGLLRSKTLIETVRPCSDGSYFCKAWPAQAAPFFSEDTDVCRSRAHRLKSSGMGASWLLPGHCRTSSCFLVTGARVSETRRVRESCGRKRPHTGRRRHRWGPAHHGSVRFSGPCHTHCLAVVTGLFRVLRRHANSVSLTTPSLLFLVGRASSLRTRR